MRRDAHGGSMSAKAGVWIDHRRAVIVDASPTHGRVEKLVSGAERHHRAPRPDGRTMDDQLYRAFLNRMRPFLEAVAARLSGAREILLFGPGEAKEELRKLLQGGPSSPAIFVENADRMTDTESRPKRSLALARGEQGASVSRGSN